MGSAGDVTVLGLVRAGLAPGACGPAL